MFRLRSTKKEYPMQPVNNVAVLGLGVIGTG